MAEKIGFLETYGAVGAAGIAAQGSSQVQSVPFDVVYVIGDAADDAGNCGEIQGKTPA